MKLYGDVQPISAVVDEVRARLGRLNRDGSFAGFVALFDRLLEELPADFFECQLDPAAPADDENGGKRLSLRLVQTSGKMRLTRRFA